MTQQMKMLASQTQGPVVTLWNPLERLDVVSQLGVSLTVAETRDPVSTRWKIRTNSQSLTSKFLIYTMAYTRAHVYMPHAQLITKHISNILILKSDI